MANCSLIVCEKNSRFGPVVRRELAKSRLRVVQTRSLAGCEAAIVESPESLVAIEATSANLESVIGFLTQLNRRYPQAAAVVLAVDAPAADLMLAEAGAIAVFRSVAEAPSLARLGERKNRGASTNELSIQEFVAERLPWPAHASP